MAHNTVNTIADTGERARGHVFHLEGPGSTRTARIVLDGGQTRLQP